MYHLDDDGNRVYTLKKSYGDDAKPTTSAHPGACARSPQTTPRARETTPRAPSIVASPDAPPAAARFSPDDKFSSQRIACKKRFGLLLTQQPPDKL